MSDIFMGSWLSSNIFSKDITKTALTFHASAIAKEIKLMLDDEDSLMLENTTMFKILLDIPKVQRAINCQWRNAQIRSEELIIRYER
ncbi:hypothetical protein RRG08_018433 [Elysia crispata]|uniref:Uncharacterized protein n=1 Tax=Elysia crispata TaxID=231223 RepID=A0AAE0YSY3_9GAST|nr:hypothetical protein RRG08_018433 [Elysia crispata]